VVVVALTESGRVRRTFQIEEVIGGATSLMRACRNGNLEMVRWLVADVGVDPCQEADVVRSCIRHRLPCSTDHRRLLLVVIAQEGHYPLDVACVLSHFDVARWLITEGRVDVAVVSVVRVSLSVGVYGVVAADVLHVCRAE
jgi:hypothetical protein